MRNEKFQKESGEIMAYKYESVLKSFEYSTESYKVISEFLLSGQIVNPVVMLKVTEISKHFGKEAKYWFRLPSTKAFISALINVKLRDKDKKLEKIITKWANEENIDKSVIFSIAIKNNPAKDLNFALSSEDETIQQVQSMNLNLELLKQSDDSKLQRLLKEIKLIDVKRGGETQAGSSSSTAGTWIHRDLAIEYVKWLISSENQTSDGIYVIKRGGETQAGSSSSTAGTWIHRDLAIEYVKWLISSENQTSDGIYVIKISEFYKIGITNDIERRIKEIESHSPCESSIFLYEKVKNASQLESILHEKFKTLNIKNEWFKLSEENLSEIKEIISKNLN